MQYEIKTEMLNTEMYKVVNEHLKTMGITLDYVVEAFVFSVLFGDSGAGNYSKDEKQAAEDLIHVALERRHKHDLNEVKKIYRPYDNSNMLLWDESQVFTPEALKELEQWRKELGFED